MHTLQNFSSYLHKGYLDSIDYFEKLAKEKYSFYVKSTTLTKGST